MHAVFNFTAVLDLWSACARHTSGKATFPYDPWPTSFWSRKKDTSLTTLVYVVRDNSSGTRSGPFAHGFTQYTFRTYRRIVRMYPDSFESCFISKMGKEILSNTVASTRLTIKYPLVLIPSLVLVRRPCAANIIRIWGRGPGSAIYKRLGASYITLAKFISQIAALHPDVPHRTV